LGVALIVVILSPVPNWIIPALPNNPPLSTFRNISIHSEMNENKIPSSAQCALLPLSFYLLAKQSLDISRTGHNRLFVRKTDNMAL
jgi:hypothetical protein